ADARQRQSSRLSQFFLLLVRGLTVALLAVALARPVLREGLGAAPEGQVTAAIVLDCSASMGFDEGGHTRFDAAKAAARKGLEGLQPGALATLVLAGAPPDAGAAGRDAAPTTDLRAVADRITAAPLGWGGANLAAALREAADRIRGSGGGRDIYVVCDRQASNWQQAGTEFVAPWRRREGQGGPTLPRLFVLPAGGTDAQNVSIESIDVVTPPAIRG